MLARSFGGADSKLSNRGLIPPVELSYCDSTNEFASMLASEADARTSTHHNQFYLFFVNNLAAILVFVFHLVSVEGLIGIGLSVGFTIYAYNRTDNSVDADTFDGSIMNWTLLSFAVITPMSAATTMAFARREQGLQLIATIKSTLLELYIAHALWDWDKDKGRANSDVDWLAHSDETCTQIFGACSDMTRFLTLPDTTRARHKTTVLGKKEAQEVAKIRIRLHESIIHRFGRIAQLCEVLKREGLPPNEVCNVGLHAGRVSFTSCKHRYSFFLPTLFAGDTNTAMGAHSFRIGGKIIENQTVPYAAGPTKFLSSLFSLPATILCPLLRSDGT